MIYFLLGFAWMFIFIYVWYHPARIKTQRPRMLAHRGLFSASMNIIENSLEAFKQAKHLGYGVELDVQLSKDNQLLVFHDASLMRLCELNQLVQASTYQELKLLKLKHTESRICSFDEVCALNLPYLMIEIKPTQRRSETVRAVLNTLRDYEMPYSLCSFDPRIVLEIKRQAPTVERGLIMEAYMTNQTLPFYQRLILELALFSGIIRPHYISFDVNHQSLVRTLYRLMKWPSAVWTVRQQKHEDVLKEFQTLIFEQQETL